MNISNFSDQKYQRVILCDYYPLPFYDVGEWGLASYYGNIEYSIVPEITFSQHEFRDDHRAGWFLLLYIATKRFDAHLKVSILSTR